MERPLPQAATRSHTGIHAVNLPRPASHVPGRDAGRLPASLRTNAPAHRRHLHGQHLCLQPANLPLRVPAIRNRENPGGRTALVARPARRHQPRRRVVPDGLRRTTNRRGLPSFTVWPATQRQQSKEARRSYHRFLDIALHHGHLLPYRMVGPGQRRTGRKKTELSLFPPLHGGRHGRLARRLPHGRSLRTAASAMGSRIGENRPPSCSETGNGRFIPPRLPD